MKGTWYVSWTGERTKQCSRDLFAPAHGRPGQSAGQFVAARYLAVRGMATRSARNDRGRVMKTKPTATRERVKPNEARAEWVGGRASTHTMSDAR